MGEYTYFIEGTSIVGFSMMTVRVLCDYVPSEENYDDALRVAQFALVKGYRNNAHNLRYFNGFPEISTEYIGVALINKTETNTVGYRFMFTTDEVLVDGMEEGTIPLPQNLEDEEDIVNLGEEYWEYVTNNDSAEVYNLFPADVKSQYTQRNFNEAFNTVSEIAQNIEYIGYSHYIFIGNNRFGPLYKYNYWVRDNNGSYGFLSLTVSGKNSDGAVIGLDLNTSSFIEYTD